jgi:hypothetical protein
VVCGFPGRRNGHYLTVTSTFSNKIGKSQTAAVGLLPTAAFQHSERNICVVSKLAVRENLKFSLGVLSLAVRTVGLVKEYHR